AAPLLSGQLPELHGRQVLIVGRAAECQAAAPVLAFAACGASVVLATPDAGRVLLNLAEGRTPEQYSDGQRALLGPVRSIDVRPDDEESIAALFERLTERAGPPGPPVGGAAGEGPDVVVALTGEVESAGVVADMTQGDPGG